MNTIDYRIHYFGYIQIFLYLATSLPLLAGPSATLTCPEDVVIHLDDGECGMEVSFDTLQWSSNVTLTDTVFFPPSGTFFEIGDNVVTLAVTDINGNLEVCTFTVTLVEFTPGSLDCLSNVQLSLEGTCDRMVQPEELLLADSTGCFDNYEVIRLSPSGNAAPPIINSMDINSSFLMVVQHMDNNMQCVTQVTVTGGTPPAITCPANITIFCNIPTDSANIGYPAFTGCYQDLEIDYFDDMNSTFCPDTFAYQTVRHWVSTDPFGKKDTCEQLITAMRYDVNQVQFPADRDGINGPAIACSDTLGLSQIADPSVTGVPTFAGYPADGNEDCKISVGYLDNETQICGASYEIERIWTVVKLCNPPVTLRDTQYITVTDPMGPDFDVPDTIYYSLDTECADTLFLPSATILSECSDFDVTITTDWDTLHTNGGWTTVNLPAGTYPVAYRLEDACGNVTTDTVSLLVTNMTLVNCPPSDTVNCDYYFDVLVPAIATNDLEVLGQLGMPEFFANCAFDIVETDSSQVDNCGNGFLIRTMTSDSQDPQTCVQEITVQHASDFEAVFPANASICSAPGNLNLGNPVVLNNSCEDIIVDLTEEIIPGGQSGCYTLRKRWRVINNCLYNGINSQDDLQIADRHYADGGDGIIVYTQEIAVNNQVQPTFPEGCEQSDLYLAPNSCEAEVIIPAPTINGCSSITLNVSGDLGPVTNIDTMLTTGTYTVNYLAADSCGNFGNCSTTFEVIDTVAPSAICQTVVVPVDQPQNPIQIWASDFVTGSDNCGPVTYSLSPDSLVHGRTYDNCCVVEEGPFEIWVTDLNGNQSSCTAAVFFSYPSSNCECTYLVSGAVYTDDLEGIANTMIDFELSGGTNLNYTTDVSGFYEMNIPQGENLIITPAKNTNPVNGVTTFDGVLITRHILGTVPLSSPYQLIAADINRSGTVTTFDIVQMRRLILGITLNFPNNTSWRFVPADHVFPPDPFSAPIPESIQFNPLLQDEFNLDFIGIKIGDMNGNADPGN